MITITKELKALRKELVELTELARLHTERGEVVLAEEIAEIKREIALRVMMLGA